MNEQTDILCKLSSTCAHCHTKFQMPYHYCCLHECGEHETCNSCKGGIYSYKFKILAFKIEE